MGMLMKFEYTPEQRDLINKEIDKYVSVVNRHPEWSNLEKALYVYTKLVRNYVPVDAKNETPESSTLLALFSLCPNSIGLSKIYKEILDKLDISCNYIENDAHDYAWNEVMLDGEYYPVDVSMDSNTTHRSGINYTTVENFAKNREFYDMPQHQTGDFSSKIQEFKAYDAEKVQNSLNVVMDQILSEEEHENIEPKPEIKLQSKELADVVKDGVISENTAEQVETLKIKVTDSDFKELTQDIAQIATYYPELLSNVELENTSSTSINMQEIVDTVCTARTTVNPKRLENGKPDEITSLPVSITISSALDDDFELDFSKMPRYVCNDKNPTDEPKTGNKVAFKNLDTTTAKKLPKIKLSDHISTLSFEGIDLDGIDLSDTHITAVELKSPLTTNVDAVLTIPECKRVSVEDVSTTVLSQAIADTNVHEFEAKNQNFHDVHILQDLSANSNIARIIINNSHLNNVVGLDNFKGRLGLLDLAENDLGISELEKLEDFKQSNPFVEMHVNGNTEILREIGNLRDISDESYNYIREFFDMTFSRSIGSKTYAVDELLNNYHTLPYYIKDADVIRRDLHLIHNPMMVENDTELQNFDFDKDYLRDGTLLLTIEQAEKLLQYGKTVPQNIRLQIENVGDLSATAVIGLRSRLATAGMSLTGVQIFDKEQHNRENGIYPYTIDEYILIRDSLDTLVSGIDPADSDLDKFATIYQRFIDSGITYDHDACNHNTTDEALYFAETLDTSRNLLLGLRDYKCVCAGYADMLRNALRLVGIEAERVGSYRHAWNQVQLDDGTGTKKWYMTDLTWDSEISGNKYTLRGSNSSFLSSHTGIYSKNVHTPSADDYDRTLVQAAFARAQTKSFSLRDRMKEIDIPEDSNIPCDIVNSANIKDEYQRRLNDMYAKFYGDKDYKKEYLERSARYKANEISQTNGTITYRTIQDYPEREEDEQFLLLDKYAECLERMSKYEAGDTSVYTGTPDQINKALEEDKEYVETRNHTFNQNANTRKDLATLGKYGEKVPYIPRQQGVLKNIARTVLNAGIFTRNVVSPIYKAIGTYVAQPIHRLIIGDRDASPFKNNVYHRMVARRDYFTDKNNTDNPGHPIINGIKARGQAFIGAKEGNEAVLRAGAADIRGNIERQEKHKLVMQNLQDRITAYDTQIQDLQNQISANPHARNVALAQQALAEKQAKRDNLFKTMEYGKTHDIGTAQTDAISSTQHDIASKEVNTMRVTVIKGFAKGLAVKYIGPKIHDWLAERGKKTITTQTTVDDIQTDRKWVPTTYKEENVPTYDTVLDTEKSMSEMMNANAGKSITGYYSVYGGERGAATYELTGSEKITGIFQATGEGGTGLSDTVGLTAPTLTDRTFSSDLLDASGFLNQNTTVEQIVEAVSNGTLDASSLENIYVSVGDKYWTKLSELMDGLTKEVQVGEELQTVVDVAGHFEETAKTVQKLVDTTEVVTVPGFEIAANTVKVVGEGGVMVDGVLDVAENLRPTTSDVKSNKKKPRKYEFDTEVGDIPTSKKSYKEQKEREGR